MSLKNKLKKAIATTACLATLLGPTVSIKEDKVEVKSNTAEASDYNLEGRLAVLGFDMVFNGLKSGIGASSEGDDFWPAFGKGALAGMIVFGGKEIASYNGSIPFSGAMGKMFHDLGVSMSDNVMRGEDLLSRYRTDFGPVEFDFNVKEKNLDLYVHPFSAGAIIYEIARGHDFDVKETIYNLTPVFNYGIPEAIQKRGTFYAGMTNQNVMSYCRNCQLRNRTKIAKSHEMNHVLFLSEFRFLDDLTGKKSEPLSEIPIIWPLAPLFDYIKIGPLMAQGILELPKAIYFPTYWFLPHELEAFTMERPTVPNAHPFYKGR